MAESKGFEPLVPLPAQRFSKPSHSTALAALLINDNIGKDKKLSYFLLLNSAKPASKKSTK